MNRLPNVEAGFFLAAVKVQETLNKAPLVAAEHQAAIAGLRSMVEHAEALTGEIEKIKYALATANEELEKLRQATKG